MDGDGDSRGGGQRGAPGASALGDNPQRSAREPAGACAG